MSLVPPAPNSIVVVMAMAGRRVFAPPMSEKRTMPSASAAARSTFIRSAAAGAVAVWACSGTVAAAPSMTRRIAAESLALMGLVMFLGDDVREGALGAGVGLGPPRGSPGWELPGTPAPVETTENF